MNNNIRSIILARLSVHVIWMRSIIDRKFYRKVQYELHILAVKIPAIKY